AVVEEGQRRQGEESRGRQHRAEREGERGAAVVLPHQARVGEPARPRRHQQQRESERQREADPVHAQGPWVSSSGSSRSALPFIPKLPSAPSMPKTSASLPAVASTSSTLVRSLLWKKEIEDGSAVEVSIPTVGARVA